MLACTRSAMAILWIMVVIAVSTTNDATSTTDVSPVPPQTSTDKCLRACYVEDVVCKSHCITVPATDNSQVNATNNCVASCPQGDGSKDQTERYVACQSDCIGALYYGLKSGVPASP
ncbi:hypothetical protein BKA57DRAFT_400094 [Linnemannia elongata]|nr:hypothetical protein BKA57DRAFT_400094 [Linnemannia elongata]